MTDVWNVAVRAVNGAEVISDLAVKRWTFNRVLSAPGALEATLNMKDFAALTDLDPGAHEIIAYRNGFREYGGYLWALNLATPKRGAEIGLHSAGFFSRLRNRIVVSDLEYGDVNQETIAWNLINHTQGLGSGGLGFTQGAHSGASVKRDRGYCAADRPEIASGITELAGLIDGFDFDIDPDGVFRTWQPRREQASAVVFDGSFVIDMGIEIDAYDTASKVIYRGDDDCNPPFGTVTDSASLTRYGLLQADLDVPTDKESQALGWANEDLRMRRNARWQATCSWTESNGPDWGDVELGDLVTLTSAHGYATFTKTMRVIEKSAAFEPTFEARYGVVLDDVVDDL